MVLDQETLRKVQLKELEILLEVKRICEKHQIRYYLYGGTLLGAVRHKGFIPWDDDIDICMLRDDYEKFLEVAPREISDHYFVESSKSTPDYVYSFCKVKANGTLFVEECTSKLNIHQGIWIDVFPVDNIPEVDFDVLEKRNTRIRRWQTAVDYHAGIISLKKITSVLWFSLIGKIFKGRLIHCKETVMREANHKDNRYAIDYGCLYGYRKAIFEMSVFEHMSELEFEGHMFSAPEDYHLVLQQTYGDYMQLPPVEKRVSEHGIIRCEV